MEQPGIEFQLYKQVTIELLILGGSLMWPNPIPIIVQPPRVGDRETAVTNIWGNLQLRRTRELRCGGRLQKRLRSRGP